MTRWLKWGIIGAVAVVAVFYGAVFIYTNFINKPEPTLSFEQRDAEVSETTMPEVAATTPVVTTVPTPTDTTDEASSSSPDGVWVATDESELGYRVKEVLGGVDTEGVGRTNQITGSLTIDGTMLTEASFQVDMASVTSDSDRRDNQFRTRIMDVETFPTAVFVLTETLDFDAVPDGEEPLTATATGELTLRGTTNTVTFDVEARQVRGSIEVLGQIPIVFADYGIPNPSIGPVSTEDNGLLEFLLVFARS